MEKDEEYQQSDLDVDDSEKEDVFYDVNPGVWNDTCPICQEDFVYGFENPSVIIDFDTCPHSMHAECWKYFAEKSPKPILCPLCRKPISPDEVAKVVRIGTHQQSIELNDLRYAVVNLAMIPFTAAINAFVLGANGLTTVRNILARVSLGAIEPAEYLRFISHVETLGIVVEALREEGVEGASLQHAADVARAAERAERFGGEPMEEPDEEERARWRDYFGDPESEDDSEPEDGA